MSDRHPFYFLSAAFAYPSHENQQQVAQALDSLAVDLGITKNEEILSSDMDHDELQVEYIRLFVNAPGGVAAPPYASIYVQGSGILMQQGHDQAMTYYRRAGLEPEDSEECEDHLRHELAFVGQLLDKGELTLLEGFLGDHLLQWFPDFLLRLQAAQPCSFYRLLGQITDVCLINLHTSYREVVHG